MNESLISMCTKLLLPIVRFCLRRGLKIQEMHEALKHALVIAAREELNEIGADSNTSKIAAITGIHRRDVNRLGEQPTPKSGSINILAKVLGQWEHDKRFSQRGAMKPLAVSGKKGSFYELVESVSRDLNPGTILAELQRLGFVRDEQGKIVPQVAAFAHKRTSLEDGARMLSYHVRGLCEAVDRNITERLEVPHLHVATSYDNICIDKLVEIKAWLLQEGSAFHKRIREYLAAFDKDINPSLGQSRGGGRVTVGTFGLTEESKGSTVVSDREAI